jgi:hypothetical protein
LPVGTGDGKGLIAEYFHANFAGKIVTRVDPQVNFLWDNESPHIKVPANHFAARWKGFIKAPCTGKWKLSIDCDDWMQVQIDGQVVCKASVESAEGEVELTSGPHAILVEFTEGEKWAHAVLCWELPGRYVRQVIQKEAFFYNEQVANKTQVPESVLRRSVARPNGNELATTREKVNLLSHVDPAVDARLGNWWWDGSALVCGRRIRSGNKRSILQVPAVPDFSNYRIVVEVERLVNKDCLYLCPPAGNCLPHVAIDSHPQDKGRFGLYAQHALFRGRGFYLERGKRFVLIYTVSPEGIQVSLGGKTLLDWRGNAFLLKSDSFYGQLESGRLAIGSYDTMFRIHRLEWHPSLE